MISFPFTSQDGDRKIKAVEFRAIFRKYFTNGVFMNPSTEFQIMEVGGMKVVAKAGYANINGVIAYEETDTELTVETAESKDRIDRIVLRLNDNTEARNVSLVVIKGTASDSPTAPNLTRNESVYDLGLATVYVNGSTTNITQSKITDTRLDTTICGVVSGTVKEADTETLYTQIQADLSEFKTNEQAEFIEWFNSIKDKLGEDLAGNLQLQIDDINDTKTSLTDANGSPIVTAPMTPPQNLLINGDFKINQRGQALYASTPTSASLTVDCWRIGGQATLTVNDDNIILSATGSGESYVAQHIDKDLTGKKLSVAVKVRYDKVYTGTVIVSTNETVFINDGQYMTVSAKYDSNRKGTQLYINIKGGHSYPFEYVDAFEGEIVYPHVEEDDATAMMRCLPYLYKGQLIGVMYGIASTSDYWYAGVSVYPFEMASRPTVTYDLINIPNIGTLQPSSIVSKSVTTRYLGGTIRVNTGLTSAIQPTMYPHYPLTLRFTLSCEPL